MGKSKGIASPEHTEEEKILISNQVCDLYASQNATLESCCNAVGIPRNTFYYWCSQIEQIGQSYKKAKEKSVSIYWDRLREKAQTGLEILVEGQTYTETRREVGVTSTGAIDKTTETEVTVLPNPTSVIFALKGEFPDRFADRGKTDITSNGKEIGQSPFSTLPIEKQEEILLMLQNASNVTNK